VGVLDSSFFKFQVKGGDGREEVKGGVDKSGTGSLRGLGLTSCKGAGRTVRVEWGDSSRVPFEVEKKQTAEGRRRILARIPKMARKA